MLSSLAQLDYVAGSNAVTSPAKAIREKIEKSMADSLLGYILRM